jgi:hypothetical protein
MRKVIIGIDVGKSGGFAKYYLDNDQVKLYRMPIIGKEYDIQEMTKILTPEPGENITHVIIENVHAIQGRAGATSNFSFGMGKGILMGLVHAMQHRYTLVTPTVWQKVAWEGVTKQADTKKTSLIAAKRLFPGESFVATPRSKTPHDGLVDAALMAYYGKLKFAE